MTFDKYIEENKKILEKRIETRKDIPISNENERNRQYLNIERMRFYIIGLEHAKKFILEEEN